MECGCGLNPKLQLEDVLEVLGSRPHILAFLGLVEILNVNLSSVDAEPYHMTLNIIKMPTHFLPKHLTRHAFYIVITSNLNGHPRPRAFNLRMTPLRAGVVPPGRSTAGGGLPLPPYFFEHGRRKAREGRRRGSRGEREGKKASADLK